MPSGAQVPGTLAEAAPDLFRELADLVSTWLSSLLKRLSRGPLAESRSKQLNDPLWGTIELHAWEVALLDTPLLQRLRGVRQLGLAQYVFPGGAHDRLEHTCGTVGAVEAIVQALSRQVERANRLDQNHPLPSLTESQHNAIRLAALLHDIGHGPFSHAIELLLVHTDQHSSGQYKAAWRQQIPLAQKWVQQTYRLNKAPSVSETLAVIMVASPAMQDVLGHANLPFQRESVVILQNQIIAGIVGAIDGPGASHLTRIISSQVDGDKLDYLARDSHHTGLEIGFDTSRLLAKLEIFRVGADNLDTPLENLRIQATRSRDGHYLDIGIAASGFGSFEQMLIGRTFLYDRLYHHHKVRAADAMAQRLTLLAEEERGFPFSLRELFLPVSDDTMIRFFGGEVMLGALQGGGKGAGRLARAILDRELYHRAFAFRGRFIACPETLDDTEKENLRRNKWTGLAKGLATLDGRLTIERAIYNLSVRIAQILYDAGIDDPSLTDARDLLNTHGHELIIVDLPERKADAIRILARYPDGTLRVPEFSFNPVKWADAYDLQKRTGYVFCPRDVVPIVSVAAKLMFLDAFGVVMGHDADAYIKGRSDIPEPWRTALRKSDLVDESTFEYLERQKYTLLKIKEADIPAPSTWTEDDPDFGVRLAAGINQYLPAGIVDSDMKALQEVLSAMFAFLDNWHAGSQISGQMTGEPDLQDRLRSFFVGRQLKVVEGAVQSGGKFDLFVQDRILLENKFTGQEDNPETSNAGAATQGRRYAIALSSRIVLVPFAYIPAKGGVPSKPKSFVVRPISAVDDRRVEIRVLIPYGAPTPSREAALS